MKIKDLKIINVPPVSLFEVTDLSDVVVFAGRNGVGKTRLVDALVQFFRNPNTNSNIHMLIEATSKSEITAWGGNSIINTATTIEDRQLIKTLQQKRNRSRLRSSVLKFESNRSISKIQPYNFDWNYADPWDEDFGWDGTFSGLNSRFQDTLHSIFRKVRSQRETIAHTAEQLRSKGEISMPLNWQDPLEPFKKAFSQLLAPKELLEADLQKQTLMYLEGNDKFTIETLSSGEREVVNIVFDFILRNPEDCIIIFDEPELHLHPELSYKLLHTLRNVGKRNQFIFCTHSPDIITASLDQSVVFVGAPSIPPKNQAIPVKEQDDTNQALRLLGQSVGIIALGKKIVLIEGATGSLDKQVYGSILRDQFPNLVLVPVGGKSKIISFSKLISEVLQKALWGVDFFMLCDRDAIPIYSNSLELEKSASGRLKVLPRYHLENFFLEADLLALVFEKMEHPDSWLRDPVKIEERLVSIARDMASYATALTVSAQFRLAVKNIDIMPKECHGSTDEKLIESLTQRVQMERSRIDGVLNPELVRETVINIKTNIDSKLASGDATWKSVIPGRPILNTFANKVNFDVARLKNLYINESMGRNPSPFAEIIEIFSGFNNITSAEF